MGDFKRVNSGGGMQSWLHKFKAVKIAFYPSIYDAKGFKVRAGQFIVYTSKSAKSSASVTNSSDNKRRGIFPSLRMAIDQAQTLAC